jgi:hypothetical protein
MSPYNSHQCQEEARQHKTNLSLDDKEGQRNSATQCKPTEGGVATKESEGVLIPETFIPTTISIDSARPSVTTHNSIRGHSFMKSTKAAVGL